MAPDPTSRKSTLRASQASLSVRKRAAARSRAVKPVDAPESVQPPVTPAEAVIAPESLPEAPTTTPAGEDEYSIHSTTPEEPQEAPESLSQPLTASQPVGGTPEPDIASEGLTAQPGTASNWEASADPETNIVTLQLQDENFNPISTLHLAAEDWNNMAETFKTQLNPAYDPQKVKQASTYRLRVPEASEDGEPEPILTLIHADGTVLGTLPITPPVIKHLGKVMDSLRPKKDRINFKKEMLERPKRTAFLGSLFLLLVVLPVGWGIVNYFVTLIAG